MSPDARKLSIERPLVAFDLETTGLDVSNDRIVEISCIKLHPDGLRETRTRRLNPGRPIAPQATAVHGITDADVAHEPAFQAVAKSLLDFFEGADLTGFNIEHFDLPLLAQEFQRVDMKFPAEGTRVIDSWRIFLTKEPRDLTAAYRFYCGAELERAHSAEADACAAADILLAQVQRYTDLPTDVATLHGYCHPRHPDWIDADGRLVWRGDVACIGFGKHKDKPLADIARKNPDYLRWMCEAQFSREVVALVRDALNGVLPVRAPSAAATEPSGPDSATKDEAVPAKPRLAARDTEPQADRAPRKASDRGAELVLPLFATRVP